jgi:hypothetical protein
MEYSVASHLRTKWPQILLLNCQIQCQCLLGTRPLLAYDSHFLTLTVSAKGFGIQSH